MVQQTFDEKWYTKLRDIYDGVPARLVAAGYNDARKRFFESNDSAPNFSYPIINDIRFEEKVRALMQLREDLNTCKETLPVVKRLYCDKIDEKLALLNLVKVANEIVTNNSVDFQQAQRFSDLTNQVFGPVERDVFAHACSVALKNFASISVPSTHSEVLSRITTVLECGANSWPHAISDLMLPVHGEEGAIITDQDVIMAQLNAALHEHGFDHWSVVRGNSSRTVFVVKPKSHRIVVPNQTALTARAGTAQLTERKLRALIAHEMLHVIRYEQGIASPLKLLAIGLAGYQPGEEGYATYCEQQINGATDYAGGKHYVAAGLAAGFDRNGEPRNFREMFDLMYDWYNIESQQNGGDPLKLAFHLCSVLFKGVRGHIPGVFLTLQTSYREGNIAAHRTIAANPVWHEYGHIGKYDFTNEAHVSALRELGILPNL